MKIGRILLVIFFLAIAFFFSYYFERSVFYFGGTLKLGWTFSSIFIRVLVIVFFTVSLQLIFSFWQKTRSIRFIYVTLLSLAPGFLLSFSLSPIYNTDYGIFNDGKKLGSTETLKLVSIGNYEPKNEHSLVAFFTTDCPHCQYACKKLSAAKNAGMKIKVDLFFSGNKKDTEYFLETNNGTSFSHHYIHADSDFTGFAGYIFPSIYLLDPAGKTIYHWTGDEMNYSALDYLIELEP